MSTLHRANAVVEVPFWLEADDRRLATWSCSPEYPEALALGWLVAWGCIAPGEPLPAITVDEAAGGLGVRAALAPERVETVEAVRDHVRANGCGIAHFARCEPEAIRRDDVGAVPPDAALPDLFRAIHGRRADDDPGGLHTAALTDGKELRYTTDEVGRHNAVDKAIGRALLAGDAPSAFGLVVSARISGEIALKAARAGIRWIASRSIPTTLALEIAAVAGIPIVARAGGRSPMMHAPAAGGDAASGAGTAP